MQRLCNSLVCSYHLPLYNPSNSLRAIYLTGIFMLFLTLGIVALRSPRGAEGHCGVVCPRVHVPLHPLKVLRNDLLVYVTSTTANVCTPKITPAIPFATSHTHTTHSKANSSTTCRTPVLQGSYLTSEGNAQVMQR